MIKIAVYLELLGDGGIQYQNDTENRNYFSGMVVWLYRWRANEDIFLSQSMVICGWMYRHGIPNFGLEAWGETFVQGLG